MASGLHFIGVLCLTSGLWIGTNGAEETQPANVCDPGWTLFNQKCYTFYYDGKDWTDAERFCTSLGANLASLHSTEEYTFIRSLIRQVAGSHVETWVGGYDAAKEGVWLWSDGSLFDFTGWGEGEPNNTNENEHCMEINYNGQDFVLDISCDELKSFLCVKSL